MERRRPIADGFHAGKSRICSPDCQERNSRRRKQKISSVRIRDRVWREGGVYGFNRSESKRTFKTEEDKQLYEERIEKKISAEERLPGDMYNMQTTMENKDNMIARLEKELSTVQSKKTKAIEALAKLRLEKQKIAGESKGNEVVRAWAEAVVKAREGENKDG